MRTLSLAVSVLLLASIPTLAQVKGAPASVTSMGSGQRMGSPASFGPPASVTSVGPRGWSSPQTFSSGAAVKFQTPFVNNGFNRGFNRGFDHDRDGRSHRGRSGFGFGYAYPAYYGYYSGYSYPYAYPPTYTYDPYSIYDPYADPRPSYPITYLTGDGPPPMAEPSVDDAPPLPTDRQRVRDDDRYGDHYTDGRASNSRAPQPAPAPVEQAQNEPPPQQRPDMFPSTTLVLKDGRQVELSNFAIIGDYVFDLSAGRAHKYRISDLDLPATRKLNDENGVSFRLPHEPDPGS